MNSNRDSEEHSNVSESDVELHFFKSKIFGNARPLYHSHIRKFNELLSKEVHEPSEKHNHVEEIKIHTKVIVEILNNCLKDIANIPHMSALINPLKMLSDAFAHDMEKPTSDKYVRTKKFKSLHQMTQMRIDHINDISDELNTIKREHSKFMKEKTDHIHRTLEKIRVARSDLEKEVLQMIVNSEEMKTRISTATHSRMTIINQTFQERCKQFQLAVKDHKIEENTLQCRKQKLDLQLGEWIEKYDKDIGDREEELQQLIQKFKLTSNDFDELEATIKEHGVSYNKCVLERTTEEKRIFDMRLRALMCARAAKTLQRAWRAHRAQQKRKKRKGGKRAKQK